MNWIHLLLALTLIISAVNSEPISLGFATGIGLSSLATYIGWDYATCNLKLSECCSPYYIPNNLTKLEESISKNLYGQHLVLDIVMRTIRSHIKKKQPQKALTLSFHGWTGGGKNYVAKFIAESLYLNGLQSKYVHHFMSTLNFPIEKKVDEYKLNLQDWIRGNVSQCQQSLFIFDEIDKAPEGLIDAIKPFIEHYESIGGIDYRRSIFIFLSNTGAQKITKVAYDNWKKGKKREELTYSDFESLLTQGAFNENGGLHNTNIIERSLIDHYIPFLPMEKAHVRLCIKAYGEHRSLTEKQIDQVINELDFQPKETELYSTSGCKRVAQKVDLLLESMYS